MLFTTYFTAVATCRDFVGKRARPPPPRGRCAPPLRLSLLICLFCTLQLSVRIMCPPTLPSDWSSALVSCGRPLPVVCFPFSFVKLHVAATRHTVLHWCTGWPRDATPTAHFPYTTQRSSQGARTKDALFLASITSWTLTPHHSPHPWPPSGFLGLAVRQRHLCRCPCVRGGIPRRSVQ